MLILFVFLFFFALLLSVAYLTLLERKIIAAIQLRRGPNTTGWFGILQPVADGLKLLHKEIIFPEKAKKSLFILAPILLFSLSFSCWSVVPFGKNLYFTDTNIALLYILVISSLNIYTIILAGWSSGSYYAFIGGMRSIVQMIAYESVMGLCIFCVVMKSASFNLIKIVEKQSFLSNLIVLFPIWIIFFICTLVKTNRAPFDLPEAEAELVAGYNVEYSGFLYALFYLAEYANMMLMSCLNTILFMGGWLAPFSFLDFIPGPIWFGLKTLFFLFLFIWIRATVPRMRYDQSLTLFWKYFLPFLCVFILILGGIILVF